MSPTGVAPDCVGTVLELLDAVAGRSAVTAHNVAQAQQGVDILSPPMHPGTFQTRFDHQFVAALYHATPNRPALFLKLGIVDLRLSLL